MKPFVTFRRTISSIFFIALTTLAHTSVPSRITYQGRLSKSGVGAAGRHTITVQFITASGEKLPASQTFDVDVPVSGDFSLNIDNIPPDADWINGLPKMRVIVGGETLTPDQSFSATPYALVARNVENLDTSKVKLAGDDGGALLSSWQSPTNKSKINADVIVGTITTTTNHGKEHALDGKDQIPVGTLNPSQIKDTALVLTSSFTQTIEPTQPVVPLVVKGQRNTGPTLNMFEVWDNAAVPTKRFHIQGTGNAYFNGNVGIASLDPTDRLEVDGNIRLLAGNRKILFSDPGNYDFSIVHNGGSSLDIRSPEKDLTIVSFMNNGNVGFANGNLGVGTLNPTAKLEVAGGDVKVSGSISASSINSTGRIKDKSGEVMPIGVVLPFAGATIPKGWLLCDGTMYSISTRPELNDLRQVLGSVYGGDGASTFGVPDLRRRVPVGSGGKGTPTLASTLGATGGEETHVLTEAEMPNHRHGVPNLTQYIPGRTGHAGGGTKNDGEIGTEFTDFRGSNAPHNNMPPSIVLNYIIKY